MKESVDRKEVLLKLKKQIEKSVVFTVIEEDLKNMHLRLINEELSDLT